MSKREFLMLAQEYSNQDVSGWLMSEKYDGMRAFWDGGASRGMLASNVPWANTAKDGRLREAPVSTGLWSRYGHVVHAPDWWLDQLPLNITLDVELWMGRGNFQAMRSVCGSHTPSDAWRDVKAMVIDSPAWSRVLADGEMTGVNWKARWVALWHLHRDHFKLHHDGLGYGVDLVGNLNHIWGEYLKAPAWEPMPQEVLPLDANAAAERVRVKLEEVTQQGGEGLILRDPRAGWMPKRVRTLLKVKKLRDAEGVVTGFTWGRRTALGSRHLGRMGALILELAPGVPTGAPMTTRRLELSGFTDAERSVGSLLGHPQVEVDGVRVAEESVAREGQDATGTWEPTHFPVGSKVSFTFRELSVDGIPKEARYWRKA